MKKNFTLRFSVFLFLLGAFSAEAQLVTSSADDGDAGTLRNQIAAAASGDIILIAPGVTDITLTAGQITIDKSLTLTATALTPTIIDAASASRIFEITAGTVILGNLSLENGLADNGGAISITGSNVTLAGVSISDSVANATNGSGGAILVGTGASLTATNSSFTGNTANRAGGAIEVTAGTTVTLNNTELSDNNAGVAPAVAAPGNGGALHVTGAGTVNITGGSVTMNRAAAEGGGLWNGAGTMTIDGTSITTNIASGAAADNGGGGIYNLNAGTLAITNAEISGNVADGAAGSGGGILNDVGAMLTVTGGEISGNTSNRAGGGIENNAGTVTLNNVTLDGNTTFASPGNGGGMHVTGAGTVNVNGGTVSDNIAGAEGGGLWNGTGTMTVDGTTISGNTASGVAADQGGGGIYNLNGGTLNIINAFIRDNVANGTLGSGGGILNDVGSELSVSATEISGNTAIRAGGGIEDNSGTITIILTNVTLTGNSVSGPPGNGGGLHITGGGSATITGGSVTDNIAALEGGGLWNGAGTMAVNNVMIMGNMAMGAAADDGGGGIFNNAGTLNISNSQLTENMAMGVSGSGGAIFCLAGAVTVSAGSTLNGNSANRAGGAIEIAAGTLSVAGSSLTDNDVDGTAGAPNPGNGGAIHITGLATVDITDSAVTGNDARREGGGLWNQTGSVMNVDRVTIDNNMASGPDAVHGGGGIFNNGGTLTVLNSTISNNNTAGALGNGGGIHVKAGTADITTTTISGNNSLSYGGGIYSNAGLNLNAVTITANSAPTGGGGIANINTTGGNLKNTIVSDNNATIGMDLFSTSASFTSGGYNIVENDDAGAFINGATDIEGSDPLLGPLADNGGPTLTHALLAGSPAYNAGDPADQFADQRGFAVFGGIRDIGAYESQTVLANESFASADKSLSQVFPNPSVNGKINVSLSAGFNNQADGRLIELASGKTVLEFTVGQNINEVNVENFASGMYVLKLTSGNISENHKVIIK